MSDARGRTFVAILELARSAEKQMPRLNQPSFLFGFLMALDVARYVPQYAIAMQALQIQPTPEDVTAFERWAADHPAGGTTTGGSAP